MPDGGPSLVITPRPEKAGRNARSRAVCRSPLPGAPRLIGGTRVACEALCRRWADNDCDAVLVALEALLADAVSPRAGVARMVIAGLVGLRRGELEPARVRMLLELGDRRRPDVELAHLVLVVALAGERLPTLELAGVVARVLRLHFAIRIAPLEEDLRDDERGSRVLLDALRCEGEHGS